MTSTTGNSTRLVTGLRLCVVVAVGAVRFLLGLGEQPHSWIGNKLSDPISPNHYQMPDGTQVLQISRHLSSNGGQAVQYIARATRTDGNNKGDRVEDLRKSLVFIEDEIYRLEELSREKQTESLAGPVLGGGGGCKAWIPPGVQAKDKSGDIYWNDNGHLKVLEKGHNTWWGFATHGVTDEASWAKADCKYGPFTEVV